MRQRHFAGEKLFVDYAGRAVPNLLVTGPTGPGKTWIFCAVAHQSCRQGLQGRYWRVPRLFEQIRNARPEHVNGFEGCRHSCSRLQACIAPRRWYDWAKQQAVLLALLLGASLRACAPAHEIGVDTARRWWGWLQARTVEFRFHLLTHWSEWGRALDGPGFWRLAIQALTLRESMAWLDSQGLEVP